MYSFAPVIKTQSGPTALRNQVNSTAKVEHRSRICNILIQKVE